MKIVMFQPLITREKRKERRGKWKNFSNLPLATAPRSLLRYYFPHISLLSPPTEMDGAKVISKLNNDIEYFIVGK